MLRPQPVGPVPEETARVARAALPKGHPYPYLRLADELGALFDDAAFAALFPTQGQPALAPWRRALATRPGDAPWRPSCNSPRAAPIAKRPTRCAAASIGPTSRGSN